MAALRRLLHVLCVLGCALLHGGTVLAQPQNGWWWNPDESGRGFFIEMTDDTVYIGGYFYEADGRATWLTSGGPIVDPYLYQGRLQSYRNGQTVFGPYQPPSPGVDAGPLTIRFTDDMHGTLTWAGGTIPIERVVFDEGFATFQPVTGWWWNEAESGTGYSVEVQGSTAFVVAFMYDAAGNPVWYYTAGPMQTATRYEGDWLQFAGGQTLTGPYKPPGTPAKLGRVTIDFAATDDATIGFTDLAGTAKASTKQSVQRRQRPLNVRRSWGYSDQWPKWQGKLTVSAVESTPTTFGSEIHTFDILWIRQPQSSHTTTYYRMDPISRFTFTFRFSDSETGCQQSGDFTITAAPFSAFDGILEVHNNLTYQGTFGFEQGTMVTIYETCPDPSGGTYVTFRDYPFFGEFEFGDTPTATLAGYRSRILQFHSARSHAPGRPLPAMYGLRPYHRDQNYTEHWQFNASP